MINNEELKKIYIEAEKGNAKSIALIRELLRPRQNDSVDLIYEKLRIFQRIFFIDSFKYEDAEFHKEIDRTYAEQIYSFLNYGKPKYRGVLIIGFRESAKTTKVKFNEVYLTCYLNDLVDSVNIISENESSSSQFTMDMFNILAFSKLSRYFGDIIAIENRSKKKESQTMSKFSTMTGVTFISKSARTTTRGTVKVDITDDGNVETKRPKKIIFDDIENENTIRSLANTEQIYQVMESSIDGLDQIVGCFTLLGNYLSLRGNVAKYLRKYKDDENVKIINIPILDDLGKPTWEDKYCRTNKEASELAKKGKIKKSVEQIQKDSDNFQTEYMNNPSRSTVYFDDDSIKYLNVETLVKESNRTDEGLLIIEEPDNKSVYIMSVDCAKGVGGDQSAFVITKISGIRYKEVANFKSNKISPENLAPYCVGLAQKYNQALIIPENNYPGNEFIAFLTPIYKNIFKRVVKKDERGIDIYEYGVNTNPKTKPEMLLFLKRILKDKLLEVSSQILYDQISEYPADDVHTIKQKDGSGGHFDLFMSFVIGIANAGFISEKTASDEMVDKVYEAQIDKIFKKEYNYR